MSKRDSRLLLEDILESIIKIENYTKNLTFEVFANNDLVLDATIRNLQIIGEAVSNIPDTIKNNLPQVPWKRIRGLRNRIIHEYFGVDISIVWFIVEKELPQLKIDIEKAIQQL